MIEIGHKHNIPTDHILQRSIWGYNFTLFEGELHIVGLEDFNLSKSPIFSSKILPTNKEYLDKQGIEHSYQLRDNIIYYTVSYSNLVYFFEDLNTDLEFIGIIVNFKSFGLI